MKKTTIVTMIKFVALLFGLSFIGAIIIKLLIKSAVFAWGLF